MRTTRQSAKSRDRENKKKAARREEEKLGRQIHLPSGIWTFRVGKGKVVIRDPERHPYMVDISTLTGTPWDIIERHRWKGIKTDAGAVTPGLIRKYIENTIQANGETK